ncbi:MAG TPA: DUF4173 domain-containing protein [Gemmatimonadaceae bacterium]|nr:DUF4173 domain-containing protein [Gemmatimonadaceae bacterium]
MTWPLTTEIGAAPTTSLTSERARAARGVLATSALLGVGADVALRNLQGGLGWTLWVFALSAAAVNVARRRSILTSEQILWLGTAIACATAFAWRDSENLRVANVLGTLVAIAMFAMSAARLPAASIMTARIRDVIAAGLYTMRDMLGGAPVMALTEIEPHTFAPVRGATSWTAMRALLITAPLVLVFTVLLSRADPVFASAFDAFQFDFTTFVPHVVLAGVFAWLTAGWIRGSLLGVARRAAIPERIPLRLGHAEIATSLGAVIALFTVFVSLQVRWLFGGADVVLATTGLTVAEYARRGFFELVTVATLVCPLILVTRAAIEDRDVIARHRQLSFVLIVLLAAIVASALLRMQLYVTHFGLTTDRLYATALMVWLGVVFGAMALTVLRGRGRAFAAVSMLTGFATLFALNAVNPEGLVARVNLGRSENGARVVDYEYLARLSGDAAPLVANALRAAQPTTESCRAAKSLRWRWVRADGVSWNLGAWKGREFVSARLSPLDVRRLCGDVSASD